MSAGDVVVALGAVLVLAIVVHVTAAAHAVGRAADQHGWRRALAAFWAVLRGRDRP